MIGRAAERFVRTTWASVQELAEELFATFSGDLPITTSRITINQASGDESTPIIINRPGDASGPTITINRGGGTNNFGNLDIHGSNFGDTTFDLGGPGGTNNYGLPPDGTQLDIGFFPPGGSGGGIGGFGDDEGGGTGGSGGGGGGGTDMAGIFFPNQQPGSVPLPQDNPIMLYGETVSKESGQTYEVNVWAKSPTGPRIGRIRVRFTMIDPGEEIPADVPCSVLIFPGTTGFGRGILDAVGFVPAFMQENL